MLFFQQSKIRTTARSVSVIFVDAAVALFDFLERRHKKFPIFFFLVTTPNWRARATLPLSESLSETLFFLSFNTGTRCIATAWVQQRLWRDAVTISNQADSTPAPPIH